jgi:hypothetical protein
VLSSHKQAFPSPETATMKLGISCAMLTQPLAKPLGPKKHNSNPSTWSKKAAAASAASCGIVLRAVGMPNGQFSMKTEAL